MPARVQTYPLTHPARGEAEVALGAGAFEQISHMPLRPGGWCFWNVDEQVRQHGGEAVEGWKIQHWPDRYMVAVYHSVWRDPQKHSLVDVTAKVASDGAQGTTFVSDPRHIIALDRPQYIPNWYYVLADSAEVGELIAAEIDQLDYQRRTADTLLQAGARWRPLRPWDTANADQAIVRNVFAERNRRDERVMRAIEALDAL